MVCTSVVEPETNFFPLLPQQPLNYNLEKHLKQLFDRNVHLWFPYLNARTALGRKSAFIYTSLYELNSCKEDHVNMKIKG